ncbi:MAG: lasso peptide biosynthesis B2 protein [Phenylobacterium sp.]
MEWSLAPAVHAAAIDGDLVFLSVPNDAYFCLPRAATQAELSPDRRRLLRVAADLAPDLVAAGLIVPETGEATALYGSWPQPGRRSALLPAYDPPTWRHLAEGLAALADTARAYRNTPFAGLLECVAAPGRRDPPATPELLAAVRAFHTWLPYAPVSGKCLLRSFMLLRHLRREGLDALWVFGVRTWPFHAHCWLQAQDVVLDDQPDRTAAFTPILVV